MIYTDGGQMVVTFRGVVLGKGQEGAFWDAGNISDLDAGNGGHTTYKYVKIH